MADRIQLRRDTAANWTAYNPILLEGEPGIELDTDQWKLGDGIHNWNDLPYRGGECVQQMGQSTTVAMSQKAVTETVEKVVYYNQPIWKIGNINIRNTGWTWQTDPNRVCVEFPIRLRKGDIIYLSDYTDARMFIGWLKNDGTYGVAGWKTGGTFICPDDGDYVINLANVNEVPKTSYKELANLCIIERQSLELQKKMENYANNISLNNSADLMAYKNLWKVQDINIPSGGAPWSWADNNTRVSTQFPIKLEKGQRVSLYDYTGLKMYIGWRTISGEYKRTGYWLTSGYFTCPEDGYYVFNIATEPAVEQIEPYTLANLLNIESIKEYVEHYTSDSLKSNNVTASNNSGSLFADFIVINEFTGEYYSSVFYGTNLFCLFHRDDGRVYIKIGDAKVSYYNQLITPGKRYIISIVWNNGNYTVSVNGEQKTGTYTTEVGGTYWFGYGASDTKCVSAIFNSVLIDETQYINIITDRLELSNYTAVIQGYIDSVNLKTENNSSGISTIESEIDSLETEINNIGRRIFNPFVNKPFYAHYHVDRFMQDGEGHNIIANASLEEIKAAARLGFDYVELKPKLTSDGYYINMHGSAGKFAANVYAINGDNIQDMLIDSVTLDYIRTNVRYNSYIEKYRTTVPTLEECLQCCKEYNIGAFVETINMDLVNICRQYLDDSSLILYSPPVNIRQTSGFAGLIFHWFNSDTITKNDILSRASLYKAPFIAGVGWRTIDGLGENAFKELIKELHDNNHIIGFASHGIALQSYFRMGGDACAAGYEVNPFDANYELIDINDSNVQIQTTGTITNNVITLSEGNTVVCGGNSVIHLGKAMLKLKFNGKVNISFGTSATSRNGIVSDGTNVYFDSNYILNGNTILTITAVENTTISELVYKTSKC